MATPREDLVAGVAEELVTYLRRGEINETTVTRSLSYEGTGIANFEELKKIHFALSTDVGKYVNRLPERIRRLRTENRTQTEASHGEIRGAIDWKRTKERRYRSGYDNPALFVSSTTDIQHDIPENRLVKKLLSIIVESVETLSGTNEDWQTHWNSKEIEHLGRILEQNVYLEALPDADEIRLSERELNQIARARREIYTDGQDIYRRYLDLMANRFDQPGVSELIKETLVQPSKNYKLFELFCLFGVIRRLRIQFPSIELQRIDSEMEEAAVLEDDDQRIRVFFDRGGPLRFFEEYPTSDELKARGAQEIFIRQSKAMEVAKDRLNSFLDRGSSQSFFAGRPDLIVLRDEKSEDEMTPQNVVIGEFKYTDSESTFASGLRELHEYLIFAHEDDLGHLLDTDWNPSASIRGLICTDEVRTDVDSVEEISHLTTKDLMKSIE